MRQTDLQIHYLHHQLHHCIKFNNSKLDEEMSQIQNQLKTLSKISDFVSRIPLFEEEFE